MSRKIRRNYDADFKTEVVLEVLKEQKTLPQLSSEFSLQNGTGIMAWCSRTYGVLQERKHKSLGYLTPNQVSKLQI